MKDWLRFDTVVAICALLVSVITASVLGYQTHVVEEQYAATIWPYLNVDTTNSAHEMRLALTNNGLGPALIGSAQLLVDGHPAPGWTTLTDLIKQDPAFASIPERKRMASSTTSLDGTTTIRPGNTLSLLALKVPEKVPNAVFYKHKVSMQFCYCSLNESCWNLETVIGSHALTHPVRAKNCPLDASIEA